MRILLVDDDARGIELMSKLPWREWGADRVDWARHGLEELDKVSQSGYDLIVCDMLMPLMDGLQFISAAREGGCDAKIVALSAHDDFHLVRQAFLLGVEDYLLKDDIGTGRFEARMRGFCQAAGGGLRRAIDQDDLSALLVAVRAICEGIELEPGREWSLGEAAQRYHMGESTLSRAFSQYVGRPFSEHLTAVRMQRAARLLLETSHKCYEVGLSVGYGSIEHFTRMFRRVHGMSPSQYRKAFTK